MKIDAKEALPFVILGDSDEMSVSTPRLRRNPGALRALALPSSVLLILSRLNHWLPRGQTHPEVVQGTAEFHHQSADTLLPQTNAVLHDTTALDTAVDMLNPQPPLVERLVGQLLLQGQLLTRVASWSA